MSEKFEAWGIVELMGHQRVAGRLSEQPVGGGNLLRVDVPVNGSPETFRTAFYGASAIYAVHITDEPAARAAASQCAQRPTYAYELAQAVRDSAPSARVTYTPDESERHDPDDRDDDEDYPI